MDTADSVLEKLTASNIFDLRGVVAVVTGGGTVSEVLSSLTHGARLTGIFVIGNRVDDKHNADGKWCNCVHRWS